MRILTFIEYEHISSIDSVLKTNILMNIEIQGGEIYKLQISKNLISFETKDTTFILEYIIEVNKDLHQYFN